MFWYVGFICLAAWVVEKFLLHKGGFVHTLLLAAIGCFVSQLIQDRRTKAYQEETRRRPQ
jgi:uncharacterized membrane protein YjjB (DUF3815 family)